MKTGFDIEQFSSLDGYATEENKGKKFHICLMNPPYANGLGNKFLDKALDIARCCITIQPQSYLFKGEFGNKSVKKKLNSGITYIETIDANKFFNGAAFQNMIGILYHKNENNYNEIIIDDMKLNTLDGLTIWFKDKKMLEFNRIVQPLYKKENCQMKWKGTPGSHYDNRIIYDEDPLCWCVQCVLLRGHVSSKQDTGKAKDFYTMIPKNEELLQKQFIGQYKNLILLKNNNNKSKLQYYFKFDTKNEASNFLNYLKTDFARTCLYLIKKDINVYWKNIPWFDFSDSHFNQEPKKIDDWLFKKYNISDDIRKHIEEILPDYYEIRQ